MFNRLPDPTGRCRSRRTVEGIRRRQSRVSKEPKDLVQELKESGGGGRSKGVPGDVGVAPWGGGTNGPGRGCGGHNQEQRSPEISPPSTLTCKKRTGEFSTQVSSPLPHGLEVWVLPRNNPCVLKSGVGSGRISLRREIVLVGGDGVH